MQVKMRKVERKMDYKYFTVEVKDKTAWITYNKPPINAMNADAYREMAALFGNMGENKKIRCIVLKSAGKGFIGGNDINEIAGHTKQNHAEYQKIVGSAITAIESCDIPIIAMVHGYAIGSGMLVAMACDIVYADDTAWFTLPEVKLGIIAGMSFAMNDIPKKVLYHMCLTGGKVTAEQMLQYGAVNVVTIPEELEERTARAAEQIPSQPPHTVRVFKQCTRMWYNNRSAEKFDMETIFTHEILETKEKEECVKAFFEKRPAVFSDEW